MTNAGAADIIPEQVGTNIGGGTNIEEIPLSKKKAKYIVYNDLIVIRGRPCEVWPCIGDIHYASNDLLIVVRTELLPTGLISFRSMDIFNHREVTRRLSPDHICEVPLVSRADYLCTVVCDEKDSVILESDDGISRDDIMMPTNIILSSLQIDFGLQKSREVIVTLESLMGLYNPKT